MEVKILFLLNLCVSLYSTSTKHYCKISETHTMCKYLTAGPNCLPLKGRGVTKSEIRTIVNYHNFLRRQIATGMEVRGDPGPQPEAANMIKVSWDWETQIVAQKWADQCESERDEFRDLSRFSLGQNVLVINETHDEYSWKIVITMWYEEINYINSKYMQTYVSSEKSANVANIIWHSVFAIGCGRRTFSKGTVYVCNYGPNAVAASRSVYQIGIPCSKCPPLHYCQKSLCINTNNSFIAREYENFPRNLLSLFKVAT